MSTQKKPSSTRTATAKLDMRHELSIKKITLELRDEGYAGMNKSFLINAMMHHLIDAHSKGGINQVINEITPYHAEVMEK
jgi:hypothetical protein